MDQKDQLLRNINKPRCRFSYFSGYLLAIEHYASPRAKKLFTLDTILMHTSIDSFMQPFSPSVHSTRETIDLSWIFPSPNGAGSQTLCPQMPYFIFLLSSGWGWMDHFSPGQKYRAPTLPSPCLGLGWRPWLWVCFYLISSKETFEAASWSWNMCPTYLSG